MSKRLSEHVSKIRNKSDESAMFAHESRFGHKFKIHIENIDVLHTERSKPKRLLAEIIYITTNPTVNIQSDTEKLRPEFKPYISSLLGAA